MDFELEKVDQHYVVGVGFACDLDDVLRVLASDSIARLATDMCNALDVVGRGDTIAWGSFHVSYTFTPTDPAVDLQRDYNALSWCGWLDPTWTLPSHDAWQGDSTWQALNAALATLSLPLRMVIAQIRGHVAVGPDGSVLYARGATYGAELLADELLMELTDWTGRHPLVAGQPWREIAHGISTRDPALVASGLDAARRLYSPLGFRVVSEGFARYLLAWLPTDQP